MTAARISIVTPSLNQSLFVEQTVRSVLGQAYPELEYFVYDGGSTDGTLERLEPYRSQLTDLVSEGDEGQADAVRRGFERSTGTILAWLNSDDLLAPGALQFVSDFFEQHPDIDLLYSHRCTIDEHNRVIGYWILPPHRDARMLVRDMIPQETCFWRRRLLERGGNLDPSFRFALDYELFVRFMRCGRFARVDRCLGAFRQHPASKTVRDSVEIGRRELQRVIRMHGLPHGPGARMRSRWFRERVRLRSAWHVLRRRPLPGALPGVGWDYDRLWDGRIRGD